ncbi:Flp pilus assembly complex ATPase component TadA [Candidatus Fermentibacterales bacterium]|nr:Flp pilus assembly complex ATPase component TadA [Candidatus Fermentibacterales bacterium]
MGKPMLNRLAMMLIESGVVTAEEVDEIARDVGPGEAELAEHLVSTGRAPEELITEILADMYSVDPIYLNETRIEQKVIDRIPEDMARRFILVPVGEEARFFSIAISDPGNLYAIDEVKFQTGKEVLAYASAPSAIRRTLDEIYGKVDDLVTVEESLNEYDEEEDSLEVVDTLEYATDEEDEEAVVADSTAGMEDEPVVKFVNDLIMTAVRKEVSDIHVEPYEKYVRVRYRQDGTCHVVGRVPKKLQAPVLSRLKILSRMNIAERRKTQDGRIKANIDDRTIDFRVSAVPAINGEKIVLRILDRGNLEFDLRQLGFPEDGLKTFMKGINSPFGIVLVTGPTGSGKTTTLYSALSQLNTPAVNIHTTEDPIEYHIEGITQTQVDPGMGYDFAASLRAILRHDPNIIMVGEIRDYETAAIAMKASLTGHLVFSTIHTNDAPSTVSRLVDIGIKPFLVASAINVIMAQRLVRKVCTKCREPVQYEEAELVEAGIDPLETEGATFFKGIGCTKCNGTGYKGRLGIFEVLSMTRDLKQAVMDRVPTGRLRVIAVSEGMRTLRMDAVDKLTGGVTTLEEVTRVTADDDEEVKRARKKFLRKKERDKTA